MAVTEITLTKIPLSGGVALPTLAALGSEGAKIPFTEQDTKTLILVENTGSEGQIVFKAGSGIQGVADLAVTVGQSKTMAFVLESGLFKREGAVFVTGPTTMKVGALLLP